jgi:hypothetical protein
VVRLKDTNGTSERNEEATSESITRQTNIIAIAKTTRIGRRRKADYNIVFYSLKTSAIHIIRYHKTACIRRLYRCINELAF